MAQVLDELLEEIKSVEPLPQVAMRVMQIASHEDLVPRDLVNVVQSDPGITAKVLKLCNSALFGFKRDLIHGMWSVARAFNEVDFAPTSGPCRLDVIFKGPIWIGASTDFKLSKDAGAQRVDLFCSGNDRPCITALLRDVIPGEAL